jgi:hypothetical protein
MQGYALHMKIVTGIASTMHVDAHNDRFAREALESSVRQIRSRFIPFLIDHDFNQQVGVLLCGKVEPLPDGEFGLFVVAGVFDKDGERDRYANGAANTVWRQYEHYLDGLPQALEGHRSDRRAKNQASIREYDPDNIAALIETHLDSTSIWIDGRVYKVKHLIASTADLSIHVYPKDHAPAHFHVISKQRGINARFDLNTLEPIYPDSIATRDAKKIKDFFESCPDKLKKLKSEYVRMQ